MTVLPTKITICFLGAGSMAEAIVRGLIHTKTAQPDQISVVNRQNRERLNRLREGYGIRIPDTPSDKEQYIAEARVVVAAMKPKDAAEGLTAIKSLLHPDQLLVSVIAGLPIGIIEQLTIPGLPVARTMPNTSSAIGLGATGLSYSAAVTEEQKHTALAIFQAVGLVSEVAEPLLDTVTGVSGSGPAYVYYLMESMIQAGIDAGLSAESAKQLTVQTVLGAAQMVRETEEEPAVLRRKVTSPGGTTEAAIRTLDHYRFSEAVRQAVQRAEARAGEISQSFTNG